MLGSGHSAPCRLRRDGTRRFWFGGFFHMLSGLGMRPAKLRFAFPLPQLPPEQTQPLPQGGRNPGEILSPPLERHDGDKRALFCFGRVFYVNSPLSPRKFSHTPNQRIFMTAKTIAILGAGQMGGGIAQVCALAGLRADLHDSNSDQLARAVESISRRISRLAEKGAAPKERAAEAVKRVFPRPEIGKWLENADFAVEAVAENAEVKRAVLRQARSRLRKDAVLATNTSSISITELAAGLPHPENFIGMHFMNPVPMMPLVEVIPGAETSAETVARTESLARELGKTSARAADYPGFITNRILMPMLNEAFFARMENIGGAADIDLCMKLGMRHPMGPLELADFIGLDTCLAVLRVMHQGFGDPKFRPCPLLVKMVAAGRLGKKSGVGFYDYRGEKPMPAEIS